MDVKPRDALPLDARTLPARYYIDPDHFLAERERFFARKWVCVGREDEVSRPGDAVLREVADESLIIVRGDDGEIRAFYNVCRHRGTRLLTEPESCVGKRIQCPYHAWTYDLQGRLVAAPHMEEGPRFQKADYPLKAVALGRWDGHLFVNLGEDPEPLEVQLSDLPDKFRAWGMGDLRRAHRIVYDVKANWKLILQNFSECLHCAIIHPALQQLSHYLSGENEPATSTYLGGRMDLRDGIETLAMGGKSRRATLPGLSEADRKHVYFYVLLPNLLLSLHPDYMITHRLHPTACDRTEIICDFHVHAVELARADFDLEDVVEFWDQTNRQDWHVSELTQLGLKSRSYSPGPYSDREDLLYALDRIIVREDP
jgi:phenylpropionate dioxygenase-like ring-hydroxylating dioxygenase large terminal subunit